MNIGLKEIRDLLKKLKYELIKIPFLTFEISEFVLI